MHPQVLIKGVIEYLYSRDDLCIIHQRRKNLLAQYVSNEGVLRYLDNWDQTYVDKIVIDPAIAYNEMCMRIAEERLIDVAFPYARTIWYEDLIADWDMYIKHIQTIAEWRIVELDKFQSRREDMRLTQDRVINPEVVEELRDRPFSYFIYWE